MWIYSFTGYCKIVFLRGYSNLYSHQPYMSVAISPVSWTLYIIILLFRSTWAVDKGT